MKKLLFLAMLPFIIHAQAVMNVTGMGIELNSYGRLRIYNENLLGKQYIDQVSPLVATSPNTVFDYYQDSGIQDTVQLQFSSAQSDTGIYTAYNNSYSGLPPSVLIKENLFAWTGSPFILIKFTVFNTDSIPVDAITGMEIVPKISGYYGEDTISYNFDKQFFKIYKGAAGTAFKYFSPDSVPLNSLAAFNWFPLYQKDSLYYQMMTKNIPDTLWYSDNQGAIVITGHQLKTLAPMDSLSFFYAVTISNNDSVTASIFDQALLKFNRIVTGMQEELTEIPTGFQLYQNYPNPFNPSTTISFSLPKQLHIRLNVYNILGQQVSTLLDEVKASGIYKINFNASSLPSGVYIYRLEGEGISVSRKMLLIK